jgi:hypothetical protein
MNSILSQNIDTSLVLIFIFGFLTGYLSMTIEAKMIKNGELDRKTMKYVDFGSQYLTLPFIYGLIAVILAIIIRSMLPDCLNSYWTMGLLFGLIIPTVKLIDDYAIKVYGVSKTFIYGWDLMVYTLFWGLILQPMAHFI